MTLTTEKNLGATLKNNETTFRIFAPRANSVNVTFFSKNSSNKTKIPLSKESDGCWAIKYPKNLKNYHYHYGLTTENPRTTKENVVDPYALATVSPDGPGIILEEEHVKHQFTPPEWQDLIILEVHLRDLLAKSEKNNKRPGFRELTSWIKSKDCYVNQLGANAVELQPITEFDCENPEEYHWGYMPAHYFSPSSAYASNPTIGSQVKEFKELVKEFHRSNKAVILDMVYNHAGEKNSLQKIDKLYYFRTTENGDFSNCSGCGNDLRTESPMSERLIVDSLSYFIKTFDVDGFRLDLAELLGLPILQRIEQELKKIKPSVILIAEPWSFRGHIAEQLKDTGWSCWNDGYRNFLKDYVKGNGNFEGIRYFLKGSIDHLSRFPSQSVNYTESHDDRCWIDSITENANFNGNDCTTADQQRTKIMFAILMMSLGIPMIAEGQDFLRSKFGINNTYNRGDINELDYNRLEEFCEFSDYVRGLIKLRRSELGRLLRLYHKPNEQYFKFFHAPDSSAFAAIYNDDLSLSKQKLMFAANPHNELVTIHNVNCDCGHWVQIADMDKINLNGIADFANKDLSLPPISCAIFVSQN